MNNRIFFCIVESILLLVMTCCQNPKYEKYSSHIDNVLKQAKGNRPELEKALDYFISQNDSLKIRAIVFLIENIVEKYSIIPKCKDDVLVRMIKTNKWIETEAWEPSQSKIGLALDSIFKIANYKPDIRIVKDIDVITGDFLIQNVELAFKMWRHRTSSTSCSFENFCEYILPYRIGHEPLTNWRKEAYSKYIWLKDSIQSPIEIAKVIVKHGGIHYNAGMSKYPYILTFKELDNIHWGSCDHLSAYLTLSLRALGIASSIDIVPAWANRNSGHAWNVVMDENGKFVDFGFNTEGSNDILYKISKIYRVKFSKNNNMSYCLNPLLKDVTNEYSLPLSEISVIVSKKYNSNAFLCTFNNHEWIPVAIVDTVTNTNIIFKNVARGIPFGNKKIFNYENEGKGIVYLPVYIKNSRINAYSNPIIINENGSTHILSPDFSNLNTVTLYRKYPKYEQFSIYSKRLSGGLFEISDHANFQKKSILFRIKEETSQAITEVVLSKPIKCKYIRYVAPDKSWVNMSELQFYYKENKIQGIPFASNPNRTQNELNMICDDNIETFYAGEAQNAYVGISFGKEVNIDKIVYAPRTDGNDIIPGEVYELFYWNNKWKSLGQKVASNYFLEYSNVPNNSLLWLRNHTKGVEERIFTYENNKQKWW